MATIWIVMALMLGACAGFFVAACVMLMVEARQPRSTNDHRLVEGMRGLEPQTE